MRIHRLPDLLAVSIMVILGTACSSNSPLTEPKQAALRVVQPPRAGTPSSEAAVAEPAKAVQEVEYFGGQSAQTVTSGQQTGSATDGRRFELNMQEADVRGVIDAILGDILKANYTVAPQVQGRLTLRTGHPVTKASLLAVLETALLSVSAAIIEDNGSFHVVPLDAAPQRIRGARRLDDSRTTMPGYGIEVVPLRYVSAREMQKLLESFTPKGSVLQADDAHGHLILAGTGQERAAMMRTIDAFDVDWLVGTYFAVYRLDQVAPEQLIGELKQVFQPPLELMNSRVRLVPLERMQAVLGIARTKSDLETVAEWIRRLDVPAKSGGRRLYVYSVQNGSAKDLASSLQLVLTGEVSSPKGAPRSGMAEAPQGRSDALGSPNVSAPDGAAFMQQGDVSRVVPNEENNSLLMFCTDQEYRLVRDALQRLDILPRQVLIEAILAEVTLNDDLRYGVQWYFKSSGRTTTLSSNQDGSVDSQFPGFSYIYTGRTDVRAVINALQSKTDVKVLSAPKLVVLNNQKASLQVGDQVPIRTQISQATIGAGSPVITSIQMQDTGVILEVTPRVNDNGNVILDVTQEVSDVAATTSSGIDSPTIQRRRLHTVVATRDGATIAMGGLIRENASVGRSGIPLLMDIPVVGNLFRSNTSDSRRTELLVLLVPHVMRNHEETEVVVDALVESLNSAAEFAGHAAKIAPAAR